MVTLPADSELRLPRVLNFMRAMWGVAHGLQAASKHMQRTVGLTGPQRIVVRILGRFPDVSAGRLAEILHLHPSTLTGILARLEEQGTIARKSDSRDGRKALFALTAKGRKHDSRRPGTVEAIVETALAAFSAEEVEIARRVLDRLATALVGEE